MDSWERFDETSLPDKEEFYSSLNMENITDIDYRHSNKIFKKFKLKNLGDYHDLYVQSDTLLLVDVSDFDMLLMVEKGIRGGICHSIHRYGKANNKYLKDYNKDVEESFLQYLDANNLYGFALIQKLPVDGFKWKNNISKFNEDLKNYDEDNNKGYTLEVDVKYPKHLHDLHSDLPFFPERTKINKCSKLVCCLYDK